MRGILLAVPVVTEEQGHMGNGVAVVEESEGEEAEEVVKEEVEEVVGERVPMEGEQVASSLPPPKFLQTGGLRSHPGITVY